MNNNKDHTEHEKGSNTFRIFKDLQQKKNIYCMS